VGFLPQGFASVPLRYVADALGLKGLGEPFHQDVRPLSLQELRFPVALPALSSLQEMRGGGGNGSLVTLRDLLGKAKSQAHAHIVFEDGGAAIDMPGRDDDAMQPLPFVPLEILESRERGARYLELDTMILASKYRRATRLFKEALGESPDDPFLLRR